MEKDNKTCAGGPLSNSFKGCQRPGEITYLSFQHRVLKGLPACALTDGREGKMQTKCAAKYLSHPFWDNTPKAGG